MMVLGKHFLILLLSLEYRYKLYTRSRLFMTAVFYFYDSHFPLYKSNVYGNYNSCLWRSAFLSIRLMQFSSVYIPRNFFPYALQLYVLLIIFFFLVSGLFDRDEFVVDSCVSRGIPVATVIGGGYEKDVNNLSLRHTIVHRAATKVKSCSRMASVESLLLLC